MSKPNCCGDVVKSHAMNKEFWFCRECKKEVSTEQKQPTTAASSTEEESTTIKLTPGYQYSFWADSTDTGELHQDEKDYGF